MAINFSIFFYLYKITLCSPNNIIDSFKSNIEKN